MSNQNTDRRAPTVKGMPRLGLGTWENEDPAQCSESVRTALEVGYRHVDTAQGYRNEDAVGEGIARADVPREDVFLGTKLWISNLSADDVVETTRGSMDRLGVDYLDVMYVHWAAGDYDPEETLPALAELREAGDIKHVGVSNFEPEHLEVAQATIDAPIFANQVEMHPYLKQEELRAYCAENDIELVAYSPLARGEIFGDEVLADIAADYDASEAQVSLAWLREKGVTAIPKATSEAHIRDNWASLGLELDADDVERIDAIKKTARQVTMDFAPASWE